MIGLSAIAFAPPEPPKVNRAITSVSQRIERTFADLDRSDSESLSKKTVKEIMSMVYKRTDLARKQVDEGSAMINIMLHGTEEEVMSLKLDEVKVPDILRIADYVDVGVKRLKYAFFVASTAPAWRPHMATLKHLESRAIGSFSEYAKVTRELAELIPHFTSYENSIDIDIEEIQSALHEPSIEHPEWVQDGDDFVKWLNGFKA